MIKIGNLTINRLYYGSIKIPKVYFKDVVVYDEEPESSYDYQVAKTYQELTVEEKIPYSYVYDDSKWYVLNNLKQYEEWGIFEETDDINTITTYNGKLALQGNSEYEYSNNQWNYLGEKEGGFGLVGQIDSSNPPSTFPIDFYVKQEDIDRMGMFDLRISSPYWELNVKLWGGTDGRYRIQGMISYRGTIEAETINGVDYIHFSCQDCPFESIDVDRIDWWDEPMDYYGNSTVLPKQYDKSIFNDYNLYNGYYYSTGDDIQYKGKNVIYNIDGELKDYDGTSFIPSKKTFEDIYYAITTNPTNFDARKKWGIDIIYDEDYNVTTDLIEGVTYKGIANKTTVGVGGGSSTNPPIITISIPTTITEIGKDAFYYWSKLTSVTIPDSVTSIDDGVFQYCESLTNITIPNSVTSIGGGAFYACTSLTNITIPNSVTSIGNYAFYSVPTRGTLYCDETWFNNLSDTNKTNLGNVANWEIKPIL